MTISSSNKFLASGKKTALSLKGESSNKGVTTWYFDFRAPKHLDTVKKLVSKDHLIQLSKSAKVEVEGSELRMTFKSSEDWLIRSSLMYSGITTVIL